MTINRSPIFTYQRIAPITFVNTADTTYFDPTIVSRMAIMTTTYTVIRLLNIASIHSSPLVTFWFPFPRAQFNWRL